MAEFYFEDEGQIFPVGYEVPDRAYTVGIVGDWLDRLLAASDNLAKTTDDTIFNIALLEANFDDYLDREELDEAKSCLSEIQEELKSASDKAKELIENKRDDIEHSGAEDYQPSGGVEAFEKYFSEHMDEILWEENEFQQAGYDRNEMASAIGVASREVSWARSLDAVRTREAERSWRDIKLNLLEATPFLRDLERSDHAASRELHKTLSQLQKDMQSLYFEIRFRDGLQQATFERLRNPILDEASYRHETHEADLMWRHTRQILTQCANVLDSYIEPTRRTIVDLAQGLDGFELAINDEKETIMAEEKKSETMWATMAKSCITERTTADGDKFYSARIPQGVKTADGRDLGGATFARNHIAERKDGTVGLPFYPERKDGTPVLINLSVPQRGDDGKVAGYSKEPIEATELCSTLNDSWNNWREEHRENKTQDKAQETSSPSLAAEVADCNQAAESTGDWLDQEVAQEADAR